MGEAAVRPDLTRPTFSNGPVHPLPCGKKTVCGRQNNDSQRRPHPNPKNLWAYVRLCGKGKLRLQVELRLLLSLP